LYFQAGGAMNKSKAFLGILVVFSLVVVVSQSVFGQMKKGVELYDIGEFQKAEKAFGQALKANPADLQANYYLGLSVLFQDKHKEALDIFLKVKQSRDKMDQRNRPAFPNECQIQVALARTRLELKQYDEAWKNLESARKENANSSDVYVYRGSYYLQQEKTKEALKELEKAISLDAKNAYAFYYQGLAYQAAGEAEKAVNALKTFIQLAPFAPEYDKAKGIITSLC
jgi:tetratricopeptide (TPR) repeat protein